MTRALWLPGVLRAEGLHVIEMPGWQTRETRSGFDPQGIVVHHTATGPGTSDTAVRNLLRDGRSDLKGPLSQFGLQRDGTWVVVAAGRCSHNGFGLWGNDSFGVEAYNSGTGEPWPAVQLESYQRGVAAICRRMGWTIANVRGHKETDPGRKIDPTFNMDAFRSQVAPRIAGTKPKPIPPPPPIVQEEPIVILSCTEIGQTYCVMPDGLVRLTPEQLLELVGGGMKVNTVKKESTLNHLLKGKRVVSFVDAPTLGG